MNKELDSFILGQKNGKDIVVTLEQHISKTDKPFKACSISIGETKRYIGFDKQYYLLRKIFKEVK